MSENKMLISFRSKMLSPIKDLDSSLVAKIKRKEYIDKKRCNFNPLGTNEHLNTINAGLETATGPSKLATPSENILRKEIK